MNFLFRRILLKSILKPVITNPSRVSSLALAIAGAASALPVRTIVSYLRTLQRGEVQKLLAFPLFSMLPTNLSISTRQLRLFLYLSLFGRIFSWTKTILVLWPIRIFLGEWILSLVGIPLTWIPQIISTYNMDFISLIKSNVTYICDTILEVGFQLPKELYIIIPIGVLSYFFWDKIPYNESIYDWFYGPFKDAITFAFVGTYVYAKCMIMNIVSILPFGGWILDSFCSVARSFEGLGRGLIQWVITYFGLD